MHYSAIGPMEDKNLDAKLKEVVGKNPITDTIIPDDKKKEHMMVFGAVRDLTEAACDLYCEEEMPWDKIVAGLSEAIGKLQGKEKDLVSACKKDMAEAEDEKKNVV